MKRTIIPGARTGRVRIPASKSQAHRLLICAALGVFFVDPDTEGKQEKAGQGGVSDAG